MRARLTARDLWRALWINLIALAVVSIVVGTITSIDASRGYSTSAFPLDWFFLGILACMAFAGIPVVFMATPLLAWISKTRNDKTLAWVCLAGLPWIPTIRMRLNRRL
jgi:hypothetical protein